MTININSTATIESIIIETIVYGLSNCDGWINRKTAEAVGLLRHGGHVEDSCRILDINIDSIDIDSIDIDRVLLSI